MSLTLAEARHRATAIEVESYGIDLDLTRWERGRFRGILIPNVLSSAETNKYIWPGNG